MTAWESLHLSWAHLSALFVDFCCWMLFILSVSAGERGCVQNSYDPIHPLTMLETKDSWEMGDISDISAVEP